MVRRRSRASATESESQTTFVGGHMTIAILIVVFFLLLAALMWSRRSRRGA
jgi:hypothetical protein